MNPARILITFQVCYGKNMSSLSRKLGAIEKIIFEARGTDFIIDPNNNLGFLFMLPLGVSPQDAESVVARLAALRDDDGRILLEVGQGESAGLRLEKRSA